MWGLKIMIQIHHNNLIHIFNQHFTRLSIFLLIFQYSGWGYFPHCALTIVSEINFRGNVNQWQGEGKKIKIFLLRGLRKN